MENRVAKAKVFCPDREMLQHILNQIAEAFGKETTVSPVMFSRDGDYYGYVNFFGAGQQVKGWRELQPSIEQKKVLFDLGIKIPESRGEASDLINRVLSKGRR
jgi:hypothetical protein